MVKLWNLKVQEVLRKGGPPLAANTIVRLTGLSFSTVRSALNTMRDAGVAERDLDVGLNGGILYRWYWIGGDE